MKSLRRIFPAIASAVVLLASESAGREDEQTGIPFFHCVLVVNDTARPVVAEVQAGLLTAVIEVERVDGLWRAVGKLRAPTGACANPTLSEGEIWQFIVPESGTNPRAKVRLAVGTSGRTIYSDPFEAGVDLLAAGQTMDCWLARIRATDTHQAPIIAAAESKPGS